MSETPPPGATPTGFQRTSGGGVRWQPPAPEDLAPLLPQYKIDCLIGRGGMGAVYRGTQLALDRPVAIKILPPDLDDAHGTYAERFKNEARMMAKMDHPAIVAVFDFGETSQRQLYFVMAFIDGTDVSQMISEQGRLPADHALAVTAHVCDALSYAHERGIVHRDIKPANILINYEGQVKVADFGLAKALETSSGTLTKTGLAVGTPDYLAPETLNSGSEIDGRADLFAIGVMLYQMLTGVVPRGAWKPASLIVPGLDRRFDEIIDRAMQPEPSDRYQSAGEFRRDLDVILMTPFVKERRESSAAIPKQILLARQNNRRSVVPKMRMEAPSKVVASKPKSFFLWYFGIFVALLLGVVVFFTVYQRKGEATPAIPEVAEVRATPPPPPLETEPEEPTAAVESMVALPVPVAPVPVTSPATSEPVVPATAPVASSTPAEFPAGQWVKVFSTLEELPADLRTLGSAVHFQDDWLTITKRLNLPSLRNSNQENVAIRFKMRGDAKDEADFLCTVALRYDDSETSSLYVFRQKTDSMYLARVGIATKKHPTKPRDELYESQFYLSTPDEPWTVEFAVVGSRLIARRNGILLPVVVDQTIKFGRLPGMIYTKNDLRDIEVLNLDGIPENEALRLLGVDEEGNDLRAMAAKEAELKANAERETAAIAAIPELHQLHEQFQKLRSELVEEVFESELAKLNANYQGGLDRAIATEKQAGRLDVVLSLEEEKKAIASAASPPDDDESRPEALVKLRKIYRDSLSKIELSRVANLKALTDPLAVRLKQLETSLTRSNRIADATFVRGYRERLGEGGLSETFNHQDTNSGPSKRSDEPATRDLPGNDRKAAEWVLSLGGMLTIREGDETRPITSLDAIPEGRFAVKEVRFVFNNTNRPKGSIEDIAALQGLGEITHFECIGTPLGDHHLAPLSTMPMLESVRLEGALLSDEATDYLARIKKLKSLALINSPNFRGSRLGELAATELRKFSLENTGAVDSTFEDLFKIKTLEECYITNCGITDAVFQHLSKIEKLQYLVIRSSLSSTSMKVTIDGLAQMKNFGKIKTLGWNFNPGEVLKTSERLIQAGANISALEPAAARYTKDDIEGFAVFPGLERLALFGPDLSDTALEGTLSLQQLERIELIAANSITDVGLGILAKHKTLEEIALVDIKAVTDEGLMKLVDSKSLRSIKIQHCDKVSESGFAAFQKARSDIDVSR